MLDSGLIGGKAPPLHATIPLQTAGYPAVSVGYPATLERAPGIRPETLAFAPGASHPKNGPHSCLQAWDQWISH